MDYKTRKYQGSEKSQKGKDTNKHTKPSNEGLGIFTRHDDNLSKKRKAVTQPTPSTDKKKK